MSPEKTKGKPDPTILEIFVVDGAELVTGKVMNTIAGYYDWITTRIGKAIPESWLRSSDSPEDTFPRRRP